MKRYACCLLLVAGCWWLIACGGKAEKGESQTVAASAFAEEAEIQKIKDVAPGLLDTTFFSPRAFRVNSDIQMGGTFVFRGNGLDSLFTVVFFDTSSAVKQPTSARKGLLDVLLLPPHSYLKEVLLYSARGDTSSRPIYDLGMVQVQGNLTGIDPAYEARRNFLAKPQYFERFNALTGTKPPEKIEITTMTQVNDKPLRLQGNVGFLLKRRGSSNMNAPQVPSGFLGLALVFAKAG